MRVALLAATMLLGLTACTGQPGPPHPTTPAATGTNQAGGPWSRLPDAPSERTEVAAAVTGTSIVVAGGYQRDGGSVRTVEIYDTATRAWTAGPPLPLAVNHASAAAAGGVVHVFGGFLADGTPSAAAFRLAEGGQRWESVADMPEARGAGTSATIGTSIFLAGGIGPGKDALAGSLLVYDTLTDRWRTAPGPPTRREHLGGAAAGGLFYTVGGRVGGELLAAVESFDPAAGTWTKRPDLPTARGGLAATGTCHGWVIAAGGEGKATFPQVELYDPAADRWRALPSMPNPRHGLAVVTVGRTLYTLPGGPKPGLFVAATTESLDLDPC
ncbi:kelch repeat-containing protein [Dactylosporangium sp. NPDC005555]|uniref:Kelch repeat-containing protein n=1 Tax=Dactylosporangium sp. NPDC005555 TaxID=3154889 RepID=UPI0033A14DE1